MTAPRFAPILFNAEMVRAVLNRTKTQTRRPVQPKSVLSSLQKNRGFEFSLDHARRDRPEHDWRLNVPVRHPCDKDMPFTDCCCNTLWNPLGATGDQLWVREAFARSRNNWIYAASSVVCEGPRGNTDEWDWDATVPNKWQPSIHMPRDASRITLTITESRAERLLDISEADAMAEGVRIVDGTGDTYLKRFLILWDSIYGKDFPSQSNPWVWVTTFKNEAR